MVLMFADFTNDSLTIDFCVCEILFIAELSKGDAKQPLDREKSFNMSFTKSWISCSED